MDIAHRLWPAGVLDGRRAGAVNGIDDAVARMLAQSFAEDPLHKELFRGIDKEEAQRLLFLQSRMIVCAAARKGVVHLLDGRPTAVLIGQDSRQEGGRNELVQTVGVATTSLRVLGVAGFAKMIRNTYRVKKVLSFSWQHEYLSGPYHRIKIIAVDQSIRGTGAFRRLISPTLDRCDRENIPAVLETHNPDNVPRYAHFGFELVNTLQSPASEVRQYCMVRKPGAR
jgi:GNAT superfamily N-acetyltransferase